MSNYGEQICRSMEIIVAKRLEGLHYDRTIVCTITDDTLSQEGKYTVCYADTNNFTAYSHLTNLREGDTVYVSIPEGDWNEQKTIVSKKSRDDNEAFVYLRPFTRLVDITNNINENSEQVDLIANEAQIVQQNGKDLTDANGDYVCESKGETYKTIYSWKYDSNKDMPPLVGYTRLGIRGEFQSWLKEEGLVAGEYGLRLIIYAENKNTIEKDAETGETIMDNATTHNYVIYLNQDDMNGDPYNFQSFYAQEKIVDISAIERINRIDIEFYQKGNFANDKGEINLALEDWDKRPKVMPNLFVRDVYVSLGYGVEEFDEEKVLVYTLDKETYGAEWVNGTENHKEIFLRWIHKDEKGNFSVITEDSDLKYEIRWYKYELGHASADEYSGVYWKQLSEQHWDNKSNSWTYLIQDPKWEAYNTTKDPNWKEKDPTELDDDVYLPDFQSTWCIPEITLQDEAIKAIIVYDTKIIRSNILEFKNQLGVVSQPTVDAMSALTVRCDDLSNGNYLIYDLGGQLVDQADKDKKRHLIPYFKDIELTEAEWLEWLIPRTNTMISLKGYWVDNVSEPFDYIFSEKELEEYACQGYDKDGEPIYYPDGKYHIRFEGDLTEALGKKQITYTINNYYSQWNNNNTIQCRIRKKGNEYSTTKELTFGHAGNNGTKWTFVLDFKGNQNAVTIGGTEAVIVEAHLYDYSNKEIDISKETITWSWKNGANGLGTRATGIKTEVEITNTLSSVPIKNYHILQANINYNDSFKLEAYLPIPIRSATQYAYITGTTQITYDTAGHIIAYRQLPYSLYDKNGNKQNVGWTLTNTETDARYSPILVPEKKEEGKEQYLKPLSVYVDDTNKEVCVSASNGITTVWSQPLLFLQNRYPTSMINEWDGNLVIDNQNNAVLAAQVIAGKKDTQNRFSGVILGDIGSSSNVEQQFNNTTGLYGYSEGEQSYALLESGIAYFGKSGKGRIYFDGNSGTIKSSDWDDSNVGMLIDIDNGTLKMHSAEGNKDSNFLAVNITYDTYTPGMYHYWQQYKLIDSPNFDSTIQYYRASSFKRATFLTASSYIKKTYYILNSSSGAYELAPDTYNSSNIYYYPIGYSYTSLVKDQASYKPNTYYQMMSSKTYTKDTIGIYNPTYTYYYDSNNGDTATAKRYIQLDADQPLNGYPLSIGLASTPSGRNFRVKWDGTVYIENGEFAGEINATTGTLGNLTVNGTLSGGIIDGAFIHGSQIVGTYVDADQLYANFGKIGGWYITDNTLESAGYSFTGGTLTKTILDAATGTITANKIITNLGRIGGWYITENGFSNQETFNLDSPAKGLIALSSTKGIIHGATIQAGLLKGAGNLGTFDTGIDVEGYMRFYQPNSTTIGKETKNMGYLGAMASDFDSTTTDDDRPGLGMGYYNGSGKCVSQFKTTEVNVGFKYLLDGTKAVGYISIGGITDVGVGLASQNDYPISVSRMASSGSVLQSVSMKSGQGLKLSSDKDNSIQIHDDANKITLTANEINLGTQFKITSTSGSEKIEITSPIGITSDKFKLAVDTGNVEIGGTLKVTGKSTLGQTEIGTSTSPQQFDAYGAANFYNPVKIQNSATLEVGGKITATSGIDIKTSLNYSGTKENCTGIYATLA